MIAGLLTQAVVSASLFFYLISLLLFSLSACVVLDSLIYYG